MAGGNVPGKIKPFIIGAAKQYGIRPADLAGLLDVESTLGSDRSTSSAGAVGIAQFLPSTARSIGVNPNDDRSAIYGAAKYLRSLGYGKDRLRALGAYNGGPGNPQYGYARQVISEGQRLKGQLGGTQPVSASQTAAGGTVAGTPARYQVSSQFDAQGYQNALQNQTLAGLVSKSFGSHNPLLDTGVLSTAPVDPSQFTKDTSGVVPGTQAFNPATAQPKGGGSSAGGLQFPFSDRYKVSEGRVDRGQDLDTSPHAIFRAVGDGVVVSGNTDFPGIIVRITSGPLKGKQVFYGHTYQSFVKPGQKVIAGQGIGRAGHQGEPYDGGPGHVEVGIWPPSSVAGGTHYTTTGQSIHDVFNKYYPHKIGRKAKIEG